jgi:GT2 family glycosyltransferase
MKLSVILVNYNVFHFLDQAIGSVLNALKNIESEVIVVDNNSVDGSVDLIRSKYPEVYLIANKTNEGFSKANNQGMRIAKGEYVLLLNPDTLVEEDTFEKCIQFMDKHPLAGGLGVKMLDGKGEFLPESKRSLPSPKVAFYKIFGLSALFPTSKRFGRYHLGFLDNDQTHEVEILSGAYMFMRKTVLDEIGLLDEDYFMYGEDIDLSYRILKGGYKNYYFPETRIIHYKGESTKKTSVNYVFIFYKAMIIFAKKHFSSKNAWLFSLLINIAIYLRAFIAIGFRFLKSMLLPLADALMVYGGMYLLKNWWEEKVKDDGTSYSPELITLVIPAYILIWLFSVKYNGGYNKPHKIWSLIKGVVIGTLFISAISNFIDAHRYSKALIVLGATLTFLVLAINRLVIHFYKYRNLALGSEKSKKIAIVGYKDESRRVMEILNEAQYDNLQVVGYICPEKNAQIDPLKIGEIDQVSEIIHIHKLDEIIFCSKDMPVNLIIEWMSKINHRYIDFKIVPDDSNFIIGSNSKNRPGEFYTLNIELNIVSKSNLRKKRAFDLVSALFLLLLSPLMVLVVKRPGNFYRNIFQVMAGDCSWVGFTKEVELKLPKIKNGIINPTTCLENKNMDTQTINRLNFRYARDYSLLMDMQLMLKSIRYLG